jgi:tRNA A37 methylthiotransferase MiaB
MGHIFPYSPKHGTPAAHAAGAGAAIKDAAARLASAAARRNRWLRASVGTRRSVLGEAAARARGELRSVRLQSSRGTRTFGDSDITGSGNDVLIGVPA